MSKSHDILVALTYLLYKVVYIADKNVDSGTRAYLDFNPGSVTYVNSNQLYLIFSSSSFAK